MASFAHVAVGVAAGRVEGSPQSLWRPMLALSAMSLAPDLDVWAFKLGVAYEHPWGHRGATHSLVFALLVALLAYALTRRVRTSMLVGFVVMTHPLLDALTDGGLGVALLWPFSSKRYFAPWQPIPVAPIGIGMLSKRGAYVMTVELLASLPFLAWALWPRKRGNL